MADPSTQSAQVSSTQGFSDNAQHNSAKDFMLPDSFLSSSPVSLIQAPQDDKPLKGSCSSSSSVHTSLRFQQNSYTPVPAPRITAEEQINCIKPMEKSVERRGVNSVYSGVADPLVVGHSGEETAPINPFVQDSSPIKTSPVSERIKALEALAAKQNDSVSKNEGGFLQFKERHYEKPPTESFSTFRKQEPSSDQDSPESPFEVLEDTQRGSDFDETADWMRAHLPPAPGFDSDILGPDSDKKAPDILASCCNLETQSSATVMASIPDAFMDSPERACQQSNLASESTKQNSVEEESEFDLNFLPTAYIWEKQEKTDTVSKGRHSFSSEFESKPTPSPPPPAGFGSPTPPPSPPHSGTTPAPWNSEPDPAEVIDVDSSGESDDTVIEDTTSVQVSMSSNATSMPNPSISFIFEENEKTDKQALMVPIINVIETDEQVLSAEEDEEEGYQMVMEAVEEPSTETGPRSEMGTFEDEKPIESFECNPEDHQSSLSPDMSGGETCDNHVEPSLTGFSSETLPTSVKSESYIHVAFAKDIASDSKDELKREQSEQTSTLTGSVDLMEKLYEVPDIAVKDFNETPCNILESDATSNHGDAEVPTVSLSASEGPKTDFIVEGQNSFPLDVQEDNTLQEVLNRNSVQQSGDQIESPPEISVLTDMESYLDTVTRTSLFDSVSCSYDETILPEEVMESKAEETKQITTEVNLVAKESLPEPIQVQPCESDFGQEPFSGLLDNPQNIQEASRIGLYREYSADASSPEWEQPNEDDILLSRESEIIPVTIPEQQDSQVEEHPAETSDLESIQLECSVSAATDSFVEFMRECLKSRQEEKHEDFGTMFTQNQELTRVGTSSPQSSPAVVMDLEQEHLTICALKELGTSPEDEEGFPPQATLRKGKFIEPSSEFISLESPLPNYGETRLGASTEVDSFDAWVTDAYHLAGHALATILTQLSVRELVYWRDPKKSGTVFGISLLLLLSLATFSVISVVSYLLLALLCVTISFRIYKAVIQAVQKSSEGHPFKTFLEKDVSIQPDTFHRHVDTSLSYINPALKLISRLFLVEDLVDSLKLAIGLWFLTHIGAVFNGITVLILAHISAFTLPLVYEKNKTQIDGYVDVAHTHFKAIVAKIQEKVPGALKPKAE